jgi:hypothetical protein
MNAGWFPAASNFQHNLLLAQVHDMPSALSLCGALSFSLASFALSARGPNDTFDPPHSQRLPLNYVLGSSIEALVRCVLVLG